MMDFFVITSKMTKKDNVEIFPKFVVKQHSSDLMIRGSDFYAVWNEKTGLWSTDEGDVLELIDEATKEYKEEYENKYQVPTNALYMWDADSKLIDKWHKFVQKQMRDSYKQLDNKIIFSNTETKKRDYASKKLPYPLEEGPIDAYEELMSTLYDEEERDKLEWSIGAIIFGDSKKIQKFIVLYGSAGSGKSTFLNILQMLFEGYYSTFDSRELASSNNSFALESFKSNPLVSIQHDGDLSRIEDNTKLNSIVSHETMEINEKFKNKYLAKFNTFLYMGTNKPVKITEAKSGIIRRLIDVRPSGRKVSFSRYQELMHQIRFELGAIAYHCLEKYKEMGENYYDKYVPTEMISATNDFYDFVESNYDIFKDQDSVTLKAAWSLYKEYCDYAKVTYPFTMRALRVELKNYFREFREQGVVDGVHVRNVYEGFLKEKFNYEKKEKPKEKKTSWIIFDEHDKNEFDKSFSDCPAQYTKLDETPEKRWAYVDTKLSDLDSRKLHYVKVPENLIVIDFDIKDKNGDKDFDKNLKAASKWPKTYAELSKSGSGIHLHYFYDGDVSKLNPIYDENIEVKIFKGNSALRRKVTKCNDLSIATINSGLPLKGEKDMVDFKGIESEKGIRTLIKKNLAKEIHPGTKPSCDFIFKILEDAYTSGMHYDVTDLRPKVLAFANNSTHQPGYCVKLVGKMHFKSDDIGGVDTYGDAPIIFFDVEVFPNLFLLNWKYRGKDKEVVRMINPTPAEVESLLKCRLIGFNNRRYDNHILYARMMGYSNEQLYRLSQNIITNEGRNSLFGEAYNLSYTDVYDFASAAHKMSLKKWEIELGIHHQELGLPWDKPVPEELWPKVAEYCDNDVIATEAVFDHLEGDFIAREILADLSGLSVNDTTNSHTTKIIFGNDPHPQDKFVYTDLSEMFPGYTFDHGKSFYRGEETGEGGYVYSEPGMYSDVALLDVASMHPSSIENLNLFGDEYTKKFSEIKQSRIAIKHEDFESLKKLLDGKLVHYVDEAVATGDKDILKNLSNALKTVINSVYGLTSARFDNKFRDKRNIDNIVAKRGALFMIDLKHAVQERGYRVAHIKTDSIKIPDATPEIIDFVMEFGKKYGYSFEHEATYDRMCLVNDAVYIAKYANPHPGEWTATGAQFAQPYVFKTLFSKEPIQFRDMCETKTVSTALYLDMNESLSEDEHNYQFVGKTGLFCPIKKGCGGGVLLREKDGKYYAAAGSKGYRWLEAEIVKEKNKEEDIDKDYYRTLVEEAKNDISKYGSFDDFVSDRKLISIDKYMNIPITDEEELPFD